jgi:hypothetical protein
MEAPPHLVGVWVKRIGKVDTCNYRIVWLIQGDEFNSIPHEIRNLIFKGLISLQNCANINYTYNLNHSSWLKIFAHVVFRVDEPYYYGEFKEGDDVNDIIINSFDEFVNLIIPSIIEIRKYKKEEQEALDRYDLQ